MHQKQSICLDYEIMLFVMSVSVKQVSSSVSAKWDLFYIGIPIYINVDCLYESLMIESSGV